MPVIPGEILTYKFSYSFFLSFFVLLSSFCFRSSSFPLCYWLFNDAVNSSDYKVLNDNRISDKN